MLKVLFITLLSLPLFASAHGDGLSLETVKDGYLVDIGYGGELVEGDTIRFDLGLSKEETKKPVEFTRAWVRVTKGEKVFFAGSISDADFGEPGLSLALAEEGEYDLFVRFENDGGSIVEASLPFTVDAGAKESGFPTTLSAIIGILVGVAAGYAFASRKK